MSCKASRQPHRVHLMLTSHWLAWDRLQEECGHMGISSALEYTVSMAIEHLRADG